MSRSIGALSVRAEARVHAGHYRAGTAPLQRGPHALGSTRLRGPNQHDADGRAVGRAEGSQHVGLVPRAAAREGAPRSLPWSLVLLLYVVVLNLYVPGSDGCGIDACFSWQLMAKLSN